MGSSQLMRMNPAILIPFSNLSQHAIITHTHTHMHKHKHKHKHTHHAHPLPSPLTRPPTPTLPLPHPRTRAQLELSHRHVAFPPVRPGGSSCQTLALRNNGDTPIAFSFAASLAALWPDFSIQPALGVVPPHSHMLVRGGAGGGKGGGLRQGRLAVAAALRWSCSMRGAAAAAKHAAPTTLSAPPPLQQRAPRSCPHTPLPPLRPRQVGLRFGPSEPGARTARATLTLNNSPLNAVPITLHANADEPRVVLTSTTHPTAPGVVAGVGGSPSGACVCCSGRRCA